MCGQDSDGDRGSVEEKDRKSEAQVVGYHNLLVLSYVGAYWPTRQ